MTYVILVLIVIALLLKVRRLSINARIMRQVLARDDDYLSEQHARLKEAYTLIDKKRAIIEDKHEAIVSMTARLGTERKYRHETFVLLDHAMDTICTLKAEAKEMEGHINYLACEDTTFLPFVL